MEIQLLGKFYLYKKLIPVPKEYFTKDIDYEINSGNLCEEVPKYQTHNNLYNKMKEKSHWKILYKTIEDKIFNINSKLKLDSSWANIAKKNSSFDNHVHNTELTAVYYLQNKISEFGTLINNSVIIPGEENSLLIFNAKTMHSIVNIDPDLYEKTGPRYSIVFDFKY